MIFKTIDISKSFQDTKVLNNLSFEFKENDFISIIGPSGSGKTTLLSIIATLNKPSTGKVILNDLVLNELNDEEISNFRNKYFGFVFQSANMIPYLNVLENVLLPTTYGDIYENTDFKKKAYELLEDIGLKGSELKKINQLSGGEQQRVAIVRAIIRDPNIIFADEPTGNLDSKNTTIILNKLKQISQEKNKIVIVVTHDPMVAKYCNKTIKLEKL